MMKTWRLAPRIRAAVCLLAVALLAGCNAYELRGKVIEGDMSIVIVVPASDPRLAGPGLGGVGVRLETDPKKINREIVDETVTDPDGEFVIPFREVGAGLLMYEVGITTRKKGYQPATLDFMLPPSDKRLLIIVTPGPDGFNDPYASDPYEQYQKFK